MTNYSGIWGLPGPNSFVQDAVRLASAGQHVVAVMPRYIADDAAYTDGLAAAIVASLGDSGRIYPHTTQGTLLESLSFNMTEGRGEAQAPVRELISHADVVGRVFVCNASDLEFGHRADLSEFLQRLDHESRPMATSDRGTMVFIVDRGMLPLDQEGVATARLWYWGRVSRWDVAGHLASGGNTEEFAGVVGEIRLETIVGVAHWDLDLALEIAQEWTDGEPELAEVLVRQDLPPAPEVSTMRSGAARPPDSIVSLWDDGLVESWHGVSSVKPAPGLGAARALTRVVWSAQARVLLPWLELKRLKVEEIVRGKLGTARMAAAVQDETRRYGETAIAADVVELATLSRIVSARFGSTEARLRESVRILVRARNRLAHLATLSRSEIDELLAKCAWLD